MADSVTDAIDVEASAEEIFAVATDLEKYPEWNPEIKKVEIKESDSEGRPTLVWMQVDMKVKTVQYTLQYDYSDAPDSFSWSLVEGDVKELSGSYAFDEFDDVTEVRYEMKADPGFPVPGLIKRQIEKRVVKGALQDLKKRVESS